MYGSDDFGTDFKQVLKAKQRTSSEVYYECYLTLHAVTAERGKHDDRSGKSVPAVTPSLISIHTPTHTL